MVGRRRSGGGVVASDCVSGSGGQLQRLWSAALAAAAAAAVARAVQRHRTSESNVSVGDDLGIAVSAMPAWSSSTSCGGGVHEKLLGCSLGALSPSPDDMRREVRTGRAGMARNPETAGTASASNHSGRLKSVMVLVFKRGRTASTVVVVGDLEIGLNRNLERILI